MRIARNAKLAIALVLLATVLLAAGPQEAAARQTFAQWVEGFWPTARAAGIKRETYDRAFAGLTPDPKVIESANFQPEYVKPVGEYVDRVVSEKRITTGKQMLVDNQALLDQIEKKYGVDRAVIIAIWGVESNYGTQPGDMNVIRALATLAYYGNRSSFARQQLIAALKILQRGDLGLNDMIGAYAGEIGQTQFLPSSYIKYGVDFDGDGHVNLRRSVPDVLASTANLLATNGWQKGQPFGEGTPNFQVLREWNRSEVYRKTLHYFAEQLR